MIDCRSKRGALVEVTKALSLFLAYEKIGVQQVSIFKLAHCNTFANKYRR